ncbi:HAD family hydrolase [Sorangium sp. So ce1504]|uniref:HAD family hydrolase n=1 Tax=Sorangium sp. So ce1504 TaxID=3133337 RepID=UPI003F607273
MSTLFHEKRLVPLERTRLLRSIVERAADRSEGPPVIVFDLDGTLMDNRPRVVAILHELAEEWRRKHPYAAALLERASPDGIVYGFQDNLRQLGVHDEALHLHAFDFWRARFFNDPHIRHDVEVPGASQYARDCHAAGATLVYLTGRDLPKMALGSFASLRDLGFPIGVIGTELVVKPRFEMPDTEFKRSVAPQLSRLGRVIAVFDNEAANCNLLLGCHPRCTAVFLDTQCAPDPPPLDARVRVIHTFELEP